MSVNPDTDRVFVAGHRGLVGSAVLAALKRRGVRNLITRTRQQLDLTKQAEVDRFFESEAVDCVFLAAAKVGGILANSRYGGDFIRDNLLIQTNVIDAAHRNGVRKLLFLASSCIYPKHAKQPMKEEYLLSGELEPTNEPYAVAKLAGVEMCRAYRRQHGFDAISVLPTNLYGPGDNFDPESSHFLPGMIRRFHDARTQNAPSVAVWGSGKPRREMMHVADTAAACIHLMDHYSDDMPINIGVGGDLSILEIAELVKEVVGFKGELILDPSKPDGAPRKLLDISRLKSTGWEPSIVPRDGIAETYSWFLDHQADMS